MDLEWEEQPFEWVRPVRFGIERVYSKGPMARMRALAELTPNREGGTRVTYEFVRRPKLIGVVAIPTAAQIENGATSFALHFRSTTNSHDWCRCGAQDAAVERCRRPINSRLNALGRSWSHETRSVEEAQLVVESAWLTFIDTGDDFAVARIRPYQFADDWKLRDGWCLKPVCVRRESGYSICSWDLLCPMCRGATGYGSR